MNICVNIKVERHYSYDTGKYIYCADIYMKDDRNLHTIGKFYTRTQAVEESILWCRLQGYKFKIEEDKK